MKKSLSLFGLLFAAVAAFAQPYSLTLQVNMASVNPAELANGVSVAGSFQSEIVGVTVPDWTAGATMLTETAPGSKIYSTTVQLSAGGTFGFKFLKGTAWGTDESVSGACGTGDRTLVVAANTVYPLNCFGRCDNTCAPWVPIADTLNVRMLVDLTNKIALDGPPTVVSVAGAFQSDIVGAGLADWQPGQTLLTPVPGSTTLYQTAILRIPAGTYGYKFLYGSAWGTDENFTGPCAPTGDRVMTIAGANNTNLNIGPFCFATCDASCPTLYPPRPVKFTVDASGIAGAAAIDGTMQVPAFTGTHIPMVADANGITYSKIINLRPGDYQYRYFDVAGLGEENFMSAATPGSCVDATKGPAGDTRRTINIPVGTTLYEVLVRGAVPVYNECTIISATENKQSAAYFTTAPNPFTSSTRITFANLENAKFGITVYDVTGRAIKTVNNLTGNSAEITREGLTAGVFFATLTTENGARFTQKLIVE